VAVAVAVAVVAGVAVVAAMVGVVKIITSDSDDLIRTLLIC
jgi:hypothetical protein